MGSPAEETGTRSDDEDSTTTRPDATPTEGDIGYVMEAVREGVETSSGEERAYQLWERERGEVKQQEGRTTAGESE